MSTNFDKYPAWVPEAWSVFNAFRTLGFTSEDIFVAFDPSGALGVELRTQGKTFTVVIARGVSDTASAADSWRAFAADLPNFTVDELDHVWEHSKVRMHGAAFVTGIVAKGISLVETKA